MNLGHLFLNKVISTSQIGDKMQLVWLRNDLRIADNPALHYACKAGRSCCVFIINLEQWQIHNDSAIKLNFIYRRLKSLQTELNTLNIPLKVVRAANYQEIPKVLLKLASDTGINALWFNHEYPLNESLRDKAVTEAFDKAAISTHAFHGDVFHPPGTVKTQNDTVYHVFTPFARQWKKQLTDAVITPLSAPKKQAQIDIETDDISYYWPQDTTDHRADLWPSSTNDMTKKLNKFMANAAVNYKNIRDIPSIAGTSTLSPYLMCGAISSKQCLLSLRTTTGEWLDSTWLNELIWREFYRHLISIYPRLSRLDDFKTLKAPIPWVDDDRQWQAWGTGQTGYPIVDAAMRQLLQTGWMHNRLRMVVAAFLTKLLLINWRKGEQFFMQHLIDGDFASNNGGWQWAASTGADAAPYFRIFNPLRQSERFDPEGIFIKKLLPELASLDKKSIHNPTSQQRLACGYPEPIVDYKFARERALAEYAGAMGKVK
jgi:deoxyribodipyrimidine photo-lyase